MLLVRVSLGREVKHLTFEDFPIIFHTDGKDYELKLTSQKKLILVKAG